MSTSKKKTTLLAAAAAAALVLATPVSAQGSKCQRYNLDFTGVWLQSIATDGDTVLAVDPINLRVLRISPGRKVSEITQLDLGQVTTPIAPLFIRSIAPGRFLLANRSDQLVEVSTENHLATKSSAPSHVFKAESKVHTFAGENDLGKLDGIFEWTAFGRADQPGDRNVLAFVDIERPSGGYATGFVWFPEDEPDSFRFVQEVGGHSPESTFYFLLHPYITMIDGRAYFLRMKDEPAIYEFDPGRPAGKQLRSVGVVPELNYRTELPPYDNNTEFPEYFARLSASYGPRGLYAHDGFLYLLGRMAEGAPSRWALFKIDPREGEQPGKIVERLYLPTSAEHLSIAPGDDFWTILEKGAVTAYLRQDVKSMLRIPASQLSATQPASMATKRSGDRFLCR